MFKGGRVVWKDGTHVAGLAIVKTVVMRVEGRVE
jgi:hypothetical protein